MTRSVFLVTGGCGMVAQHVAEAALARGCEVRLADYSWSEDRVWISGVERISFDVRDRAACMAAAEGTTAVIHCAAVVGPARSRIDPLIPAPSGRPHRFPGAGTRESLKLVA